jgi:hypothetical protein
MDIPNGYTIGGVCAVIVIFLIAIYTGLWLADIYVTELLFIAFGFLILGLGLVAYEKSTE